MPQIAQAEQGARMPSISDALGIPSAQASERPSVNFAREAYGALNPERATPLGPEGTVVGRDVTPSGGGLFDSLGSSAPGLAAANRASLPSLSGNINTGLRADMPESAFAGTPFEGGMHRAGLKGVPAGVAPTNAPSSLPSAPVSPASSFLARPEMIAPNVISPTPATPATSATPANTALGHLLSPPAGIASRSKRRPSLEMR
jgi:hypothetical protein